jgi:serine phosphatase RsbU (regulator of sigma subunit)/anti-sigma regulatory factor (Ser/Thr protein kinase)
MNASTIRAEHRTVLRVEIACELSAVRSGVARIHEWLAELGLPEAELGAWELSLIEAGNNAVKYCPAQNRQVPVIFEIAAGAGDLEARVTDHTAGFDWPANVTLPAPDAECGRGLYLIKSLTDDLCYLRHADQNVLVLRRSRPSGSSVLPDTGDLLRRLTDAETALADMTAELAASYESLVAVFRYSSELGGHADLKDFSSRLLRDLMQITEADGAVLRLATPDGKRLETALLLPDTGKARLAPLNRADDRVNSVELRAAVSRMDIWFSPEEPLDTNDPLRVAMPVGNGICHAFFVADQLVGTMALGRLAANKTFTAAQVNLLHTFVDFLAIQIVNARLLDERTAARVLGRELEIAAEIQRSLLPAQLPSCPPFALAASCESALKVGGDFYDVIPAGGGAVLLVIADVMGKGVPAALFAAVLRSTLRSMHHLFSQPGELLSAANKTLFSDLSKVDMFVTTSVLYLDPRRGQMIGASAGHCPMLFFSSGPAEFVPLQTGFPLGIDPETAYGQTVNVLPADGAALLYTDGLNETRGGGSSKFLGDQDLYRFFSESVAESRDAEGAKHFLLRRLAEYRGQESLTDDQTFILIRHTAIP